MSPTLTATISFKHLHMTARAYDYKQRTKLWNLIEIMLGFETDGVASRPGDFVLWRTKWHSEKEVSQEPISTPLVSLLYSHYIWQSAFTSNWFVKAKPAYYQLITQLFKAEQHHSGPCGDETKTWNVTLQCNHMWCWILGFSSTLLWSNFTHKCVTSYTKIFFTIKEKPDISGLVWNVEYTIAFDVLTNSLVAWLKSWSMTFLTQGSSREKFSVI